MDHHSNKVLEGRLQEFIRYAELKQLAYQIAVLQQEKMFHSLAVLSVFPGEGKTLFCAAMAMAYAETCRAKVLVVDTTTIRNKNAILLKQCFNGSSPLVEVLSIDELRKGTGNFDGASSAAPRIEKGPALESQLALDRPNQLAMPKENEFSKLKKVVEDRSEQYGIVLLDTAALQSRNRSNVDPSLVARLSHASILLVSRQFLNSPNVQASLNVLKDPTMHLIGVVANEDYTSMNIPTPLPHSIFKKFQKLFAKYRTSILIAMAAGVILGGVAAQILPKRFKSHFVLTVYSKYFQSPLIGDFVPGFSESSEMRSQRESLIRQVLTPEYLDYLGNKYGVYDSAKKLPAVRMATKR